MNIVDWNDGMSIGIKALDDDHKKLIDTINKLYIAISKNETENVLEEIFNTLEAYVVEHFHREESYLRQYNYAELELNEHIKGHQIFAQNIPKLKAKLLNAPDYIAAQEVSVYLTDWLIDHIITKDIPLVDFFKQHDSEDSELKKSTGLSNIIKTIEKTFSFGVRMLAIMLLPLIGMFILGIIILWNDYSKYENMTELSHVSRIASDINGLTHAIQIERGLTSGDLTAKEARFKNDLYEQRKTVDTAIDSFLYELETIPAKQLDNIMPSIALFKNDVMSLKQIRKQVDSKKISQKESIDSYSKIIDNVLEIASKMVYFNLDNELLSSVFTLSSILHYKEALGKERAYGTMFIESHHIDSIEHEVFLQLLGAQKTFLHQFNQRASEKQKSHLRGIMNTTPAQQLLSYEHKLKQQAWENLDSKIWFSLMTQYIDSLKTLGDNISDDVNLLVQERSHNAVQSLLLWFFYLVVMLAGTMVITHLFKESSSRQISRLTEAMQHLAHGKRSLRLRISEINDEISKMTEAYEINRKNLLKADIFTQLYMNQKEIELESRVRENKKLELMAFIDPLTSALNRRKFEELSQLELERSCRYKNNLCFLMLDIDYFKKINDTYGHAIGDEVLKHFTQACKNSVRNLDTVARMGGEEFVIMLPETDAHSSFKLAERIRRLIAESELNIQQKCIQYSVSIGVAQYDCTIDKNIESVLEHADTALYEAKKRGRNQVVLYEHSIS